MSNFKTPINLVDIWYCCFRTKLTSIVYTTDELIDIIGEEFSVYKDFKFSDFIALCVLITNFNNKESVYV